MNRQDHHPRRRAVAGIAAGGDPPDLGGRNETTLITLTEPLKLADGRTIGELDVRAPRVKDLKAAQRISKDAAEQETALVARLAGLVPEDLEELLLVDYQRLLAEIFPPRTVDPSG